MSDQAGKNHFTMPEVLFRWCEIAHKQADAPGESELPNDFVELTAKLVRCCCQYSNFDPSPLREAERRILAWNREPSEWLGPRDPASVLRHVVSRASTLANDVVRLVVDREIGEGFKEAREKYLDQFVRFLITRDIEPTNDEIDSLDPLRRTMVVTARATAQPQPLESPPGAKPKIRPLRGSFLKAAEHIRENPGVLRKQIAVAINRTEGHVRNNIVPRLKQHGFTNHGGGYYPPGFDVT